MNFVRVDIFLYDVFFCHQIQIKENDFDGRNSTVIATRKDDLANEHTYFVLRFLLSILIFLQNVNI